jgi:hypothetical protein
MIVTILNCWPGRWSVGAISAVLLVHFAGAADVKPYSVPKQRNPAHEAQGQPQPGAKIGLAWTTPSGWEELPAGEIRLASFKVKGPKESFADVSIIPLPGFAGGDLENVNRWRGQVGLSPATAEELTGLAEKVTIAGEAAQLYNVAGQPPGSAEKVRILAAIQHRENAVFFYKMTGPDSLVAGQKRTFVSFLKSIRFQTLEGGETALPASHPPIGNAPAAAEPGLPALPPSHPPIGLSTAAPPVLPASHPPIGGLASLPASAPVTNQSAWKIPAGWQEQAPGPMQMARFLTSGDVGAKADVSVAVIPGEGGGLLPNVNRWRGQIGLEPIEAGDLPKQTSTVEVGTAKGTVLDVTSKDSKKRLVVVSVPSGGNTSFYKLMGDETVVAREKESFLRFVQAPK